MTPFQARFAGLIVTAGVFFTAGCSSEPKIVPVSGRVLIDGEPLTQGYVQVVPAGYRAATGRIGPDGRFTLTTMKSNDGCPVGTHPVAVLSTEQVSAEARKWFTPKHYYAPQTSGLTVTIKGPTNDLTIELTWAGGKPFVEKYGTD